MFRCYHYSVMNTERIWPICPECRQRRQTVCPGCRVASSTFRFGDEGATAAPLEPIPGTPVADTTTVDETVVLLCATCDEPFWPEFYRRCHVCGFDFVEGIESPAVATLPEPLGDRVGIVLGLLIFVCTALMLYFAWVLR